LKILLAHQSPPGLKSKIKNQKSKIRRGTPMAEPTPMPTSNQLGTERDYRPISLLAIGALGLASVFAILVLIVGGKALFSGTPFALGMGLLVLPIAGGALAVVALWQIRASEGTRAGSVLATVALWLSLLFGLGYAAYSLATYFAVRAQAETFLLGADDGPETGFLAKLKDLNKVNAAFLLTRPPDIRSSVNPDNPKEMDEAFNRTTSPGSPGYLEAFQDHTIVRIVQNGGPNTEFNVISIDHCEYREGGYVVGMQVEVKTPETVLRLPFIVRSQDIAGEGRKWFVDWSKMPPQPNDSTGYMTREGFQLRRLRYEARKFAKDWADDLKAGKIDKVLKMAANPAGFAPGGNAIDTSLLWDPDQRERMRKEIDKLFDPKASDRLGIPDYDIPDAEKPLAFVERNKENNHIQIILEFRMILSDQEMKGPPKYACMGRLTVERSDSPDLTIPKEKKPTWKVVSLRILKMRDARPKMAGRPDMANMPQPPGGGG
jgi:hypothetical protein